MWFLSSFSGYSVTTLSEGSTEYFVAGAPRSNHSGQVIVYTVNAQKQSAIIDSERGKQVLTLKDMAFTFSTGTNCICPVCSLTNKSHLDWVIFWKRPVLAGRGQRWGDRPPAGWCAHVHERAEERRRQSLPLLRHQGKNERHVTFTVTFCGLDFLS